MDADLLLERDGETSRLIGTVRDAVAGRGSVAVVEGAAGIGKTRLLAHAAANAQEQGATVLRARAGEMEQSFAFGVVRQLFEPVIARATATERAAAFDGAADLAAPIFDPARMAGEAGEAIYPLLHGLFWLCAHLSGERPLVLCVDDAQWCDEPSLQFVEFLARRVSDVPVAVLVATRPVQPTMSRSLTALVTDASNAILRPAGLSPDAIATLLDQRLGTDSDPAFTAACEAMTNGNPFLVGELTRLLVSEGVAPSAAMAARVDELAPRSIADNVLLRVARLPPGGRDLADAIAVLGDGTSLADATALAGLELATAEGLVAQLRDAGVRFRGCLVGTGVLESVHRELVASLGLEDRVLLAGRVPEVMPWLRAADVFVLPSLQEGSGSVSVLEALQAGIPVVSTSVDGMVEDLADETDGLLVAPADPAALASAIRRMVEDGALRTRLGAAARALYERRFSPDAAAEDLGALYAELGLDVPARRTASATRATSSPEIDGPDGR